MKHWVHEPRRLMTVTVLALLLVSLVGTPSSAAPLQQGTIYRPHITDVRQNQFVVSWVTDSPCTASVTYGTTLDGTGWLTVTDSVNTTTHYVAVTGLTASTPYYFDTVSGTTVDDHLGAHYTVTTGQAPTGFPPSNYTQGVRVYYFETTTGVPNAITYLQVQHAGAGGAVSQMASARTNASGQALYNLANLRTVDNNSYFYPGTGGAAGEPITITAQGGIAGNGQLITVTGNLGTVIGIVTLDGSPTAVGLVSFGAHSPATNPALPLVAVGLVGSLGLLVWRRKQIARG